jgi:translation initiation factor IF-3
MISKLRQKEKDLKETQRTSKPMKEIQIGANIADHDFEMKVSKIKEMLDDGHAVKIIVMIKRSRTMKIEPVAIDKTILRLLETLENHGSSVQQLDSEVNTRRDLIISPIKK